MVHFSVSIRPLTNRRCISTTTKTGGSMASTAVAIATCHSAKASLTSMIFLMPITMVCIMSRLPFAQGILDLDDLLDADHDGLHVVARRDQERPEILIPTIDKQDHEQRRDIGHRQQQPRIP